MLQRYSRAHVVVLLYVGALAVAIIYYLLFRPNLGIN